MTTKNKIAVLGGDARQLFMLRHLLSLNYPVAVWGLGEEGKRRFPEITAPHWQAALEKATAMILPLPVSADGVRLRCPLESEALSLRLSILLEAFSGKLILGGRFPEAFLHSAAQKGVEPVDYSASEDFLLNNALLTAEGAIALAMERLPVAIDGSTVAVIGYGRIGALLADRLRALGATVLVYARRRDALTRAALCHHTPVLLRREDAYQSLREIPAVCRVIFNTVPQCLFSGTVLEALPKQCLFVDLASVPGGLDRAAADELKIPWIWGTALPGKYAPESAGRILGQTVGALLEEHLD